MRRQRGQAIVELVLTLPAFLAVALGGLTLCRLAVGQVDVQLAAWVAAASRDPAAAARAHLAQNGVTDPGKVSVQVTRVGFVRRVTVSCPVTPGWWPGGARSEVVLSASAGRGRALLAIRAGR